MTSTRTAPKPTNLFARLHAIKFGADVRDPKRIKLPQRDLALLVCNLATMVGSGLSLPKALTTLTKERGLRRYAWMLNMMRRRIENGEPFSRTLAVFPRTFSAAMVQQVKVGEQTGEMAATLERLAEQLQRKGNLRQQLLKRLSYPALVMIAGTGLVIFMMTVVVPQFEQVYKGSEAQLPWITQMVSGASRACFRWGWLGILGLIGLWVAAHIVRRHPVWGVKFDEHLLRIPVAGQWLRDYAVLQFIDATNTMIESGFVPLEAIACSVGSVGNKAVRGSVEQLRTALLRGERLSVELNRADDLFPPTVSQLVAVGEATGDLKRATRGARDHLEQRLRNRMDVALGLIEPVLTVAMAAVIGAIVLAIYLPMFGMIDAME